MLTVLERQEIEDGVEHGDDHGEAQQPGVPLNEHPLQGTAKPVSKGPDSSSSTLPGLGHTLTLPH